MSGDLQRNNHVQCVNYLPRRWPITALPSPALQEQLPHRIAFLVIPELLHRAYWKRSPFHRSNYPDICPASRIWYFSREYLLGLELADITTIVRIHNYEHCLQGSSRVSIRINHFKMGYLPFQGRRHLIEWSCCVLLRVVTLAPSFKLAKISNRLPGYTAYRPPK